MQVQLLIIADNMTIFIQSKALQIRMIRVNKNALSTISHCMIDNCKGNNPQWNRYSNRKIKYLVKTNIQMKNAISLGRIVLLMLEQAAQSRNMKRS